MYTQKYCLEQFNINISKYGEIGYVSKVVKPFVYVSGLPRSKMRELLFFEDGQLGVVTGLLEEYVEVLLLRDLTMKMGAKVTRSDLALSIPVSTCLLGKIVDALGFVQFDMNSNDTSSSCDTSTFEYRDIDPPIKGIDKRTRIKQPFVTGVPLVDLLIPLGRGQRELVIGDRNIGKTSFTLQAMKYHIESGGICIYASIGKKMTSVKKLEGFIKQHSLSSNFIGIFSSSASPLGMIYLTPFSALTLAEYFVDQGKDVLVILDDMTTHAKYYREMSLIAHNFPGRDSYPGNIFYVQSKLLERSGNFISPDGTAHSITCLPIAETIGGDLSGYMSTNLMSVTDGHIFFDPELFKKGTRPAINFFLSVTRVGRQTQDLLRWGIHRELSAFFVLFQKTEKFIHFGAELNEGIKATLAMGKKLDVFFNQSFEMTLDLNIQILLFCLIWTGLVTDGTGGKLSIFINKAIKLYKENSDYAAKVNSLVESSVEFNELLGKVRTSYKELILPVGVDMVETGGIVAK